MREPLVRFTAHGVAQPAGSKSIGKTKDGRAFIRHANATKQKPWRGEVARAAGEAMQGKQLLDGGLRVDVTFFRPRPKSHFTASGGLSAVGRRDEFPASKPDLSKLVRATEDALKGIVWRDDGQVCCIRAMKMWGEPAKAMVEVYPA